ncbi:MAG: heparinase II/III family protein [Bacteroidota bacterium]
MLLLSPFHQCLQKNLIYTSKIVRLGLFFLLVTPSYGQKAPEIQKLDHAVSITYLQENISKVYPRLILNPHLKKQLKNKLANDPVIQNLYAAIQQNAEKIYQEPLLERKQIGRRLLSVSREMLYRMNILGMVYAIDPQPKILERIKEEIRTVCQFSDWNPSHFLDVAEMTLAVAIGLDWTYQDMDEQTRELALTALVEKGIKPSYDQQYNWWVRSENNWNQVCHGGMIAAALMVAEREPELASRTLQRALDGIPYALKEYGPDGAYPEGSTYWGYGTSFSVLTISMLRSALGEDFGIADYPAFQKSAQFRLMCNAPSGMYYNFADCGDRRNENGDWTLAWFATETQTASYFEKDRFLQPEAEMGKLSRWAGAGLVWVSQYKPIAESTIPTAYKAEGANPIAIFMGRENGFYLGAKGGRGTVNHGNMDAGSFVFELNGVRWVVDPGNQNYNDLEETGFDLWGKCQACERWTLLTKNNLGHSTLTVNGELHVVEGMSELVTFNPGNNPSASFDLSPTFEGQLQSAMRTFTKESESSLVIEDELALSPGTKEITWQLLTQSEIEFTSGGAILHQEGQTLKLENLSHPDLHLSVVSLDPPPLKLDRKIEGLKRLELSIPAYTIPEGKTTIRIRLSGN